MAKSYSLVFIVLFLLTLGSCQSLEQIPIDYLQPADLSFPPQLRKVAIVNNTSDAPDNKLITETEKIKEGTPLISRATAYANGDPKAATESLAEEIATTAALGAIQDAVESDTPALGYTVTYAVGNTLLIIWGVVIVLLM